MKRLLPILLMVPFFCCATTARADGPSYAIQVGAFSSAVNAQNYANRFAALELPRFIDQGPGVYRVRLGAFPTAAAAKSTADTLRQAGRISSYLIVQRVTTISGSVSAVELPEPAIRSDSAAPGTDGTQPAQTLPANEDIGIGVKVAEIAQKFQGIPYKYGGTTVFGFDCSGFVQAMYRLAGVTLPRTAASQYTHGRAISRNALKPGDLVFFSRSGMRITHVGIFTGDGNFIHAPQTGDVIRISSLDATYYRRTYRGARRPY